MGNARPDQFILLAAGSCSRFEPSCNALAAIRFVRRAAKVVGGDSLTFRGNGFGEVLRSRIVRLRKQKPK